RITRTFWPQPWLGLNTAIANGTYDFILYMVGAPAAAIGTASPLGVVVPWIITVPVSRGSPASNSFTRFCVGTLKPQPTDGLTSRSPCTCEYWLLLISSLPGT